MATSHRLSFCPSNSVQGLKAVVTAVTGPTAFTVLSCKVTEGENTFVLDQAVSEHMGAVWKDVPCNRAIDVWPEVLRMTKILHFHKVLLLQGC